MSTITTHILDTSLGRPAEGVPVLLEHYLLENNLRSWKQLGRGVTDADGRLRELLPDDAQLAAGDYRLIFDTGVYFKAQQIEAFFPTVIVVFTIRESTVHHHVPLLLSPFGYSTYRGS